MKRSKSFWTTTILFFVLFLTNNVAAKDEWVKIQPKNFQLYGNADARDIRRVATKLEQFREFFRQTFSGINFSSPIPTNVLVFKDQKTFRDYKPIEEDGSPRDWVAGYFQAGEDANYIALSIEGEKNDDFSTIFHEYIHYLINNNLGRTKIPPWFNEGLAEYYETFQIENDQKISIGNVNNKHLLLLRQSKLIPFETFFGMDNYTLYRQGRDGVGLFYAQAWALMHYLIQNGNQPRNQQLNKFVQLILSGKTPKQAFGDALQVDYTTLERELKKYIEQKTLPISVINTNAKLVYANEMLVLPVTEAESKAVLGDLLFHANRLTEAEALLEESLRMNADSSRANASLGLVKMRQEKFAEAKKYFEKAVALDDENYLVHFQYAYALSREGMTFFGFVSGYDRAQLEKMRQLLKRAIQLNPDFAESYNLYAFISFVSNEDIDEALVYVDRALKIAPGNQSYQLRAAELYSRKEDFSKARQIAQRVFETAPDDRLRVYAKGTIANINSLEAQLEDIKNNKNRLPETEVSDKPLTEEELAALNEKVMRRTINYNLRRPKQDEKRVLGYLTKIECVAGQVLYSLKIGEQNLVLRSENFDALYLMSYDQNLSGNQVGCGTIKQETFAVMIYRPSDNSHNKTAGEILSIEFVPKNFQFLN